MKFEGDVGDKVKDITSLPLALGGLGVRSATRTTESAFWASWANSLAMIHKRHPTVVVASRVRGADMTPTLLATTSLESKVLSHHFGKPWLMGPVRQNNQMILNQTSSECFSPGAFVSLSLSLHASVDAAFLWTSAATIALRVRERGSWDGRGFQRRVWQPASAEKEGPEWQPISWSEIWISGRPTSLTARGLKWLPTGCVCSEACSWLAVDTTLVSPLHCDGTARPHAAHVDGAVLEVARRKKEATYPELGAPRARARLVVWAGEVNGRWSEVQGVPEPAGQSTLGNSSDAATCGTGLENALGRDAGLHRGTCFCRFIVELALGRRRAYGEVPTTRGAFSWV